MLHILYILHIILLFVFYIIYIILYIYSIYIYRYFNIHIQYIYGCTYCETMGSVSEANALVPDPNVAVPEGTLPASGVAGEALQEAEPKSPENVDAGNPPEPGTGGIY